MDDSRNDHPNKKIKQKKKTKTKQKRKQKELTPRTKGLYVPTGHVKNTNGKN